MQFGVEKDDIVGLGYGRICRIHTFLGYAYMSKCIDINTYAFYYVKFLFYYNSI